MLQFTNNVFAKLDLEDTEFLRLKEESFRLGYSTTYLEKLNRLHDCACHIRTHSTNVRNSNVADNTKNDMLARNANRVQTILDGYKVISDRLKAIAELDKQQGRAFNTTPDDVTAMKMYSSARPGWVYASSGDNS
ncbi:MAG: hypothetical protein AB7I18_07645 [Candidatus Berkiella sp.]